MKRPDKKRRIFVADPTTQRHINFLAANGYQNLSSLIRELIANKVKEIELAPSTVISDAPVVHLIKGQTEIYLKLENVRTQSHRELIIDLLDRGIIETDAAKNTLYFKLWEGK